MSKFEKWLEEGISNYIASKSTKGIIDIIDDLGDIEEEQSDEFTIGYSKKQKRIINIVSAILIIMIVIFDILLCFMTRKDDNNIKSYIIINIICVCPILLIIFNMIIGKNKIIKIKNGEIHDSGFIKKRCGRKMKYIYFI